MSRRFKPLSIIPRAQPKIAKDPDRRPIEVMKFAGVAPGQKVLDLFSAGGWYAELLAGVVGPTGQVYMQNPTDTRMGSKAADERLAGDRLRNVVRWDKPMNEMDLPPAYFDGAMLNLVYHDFYTLSDDVDDVLADLYAGLKPGAWVVVVDHSAPAGTGKSFATDPRGAHRIDEAFAKASFAKAGFVLEAESDLMRNTADDRQKAFFTPEMKGKTTDKFVLRFRKPG
ncbi:MAG: class I SAM-dependent methyltransferase [Proteobacteria bacterium]|nr:class I SAM-dependent methyltransferase [Pseudomonadota bacterium]